MKGAVDEGPLFIVQFVVRKLEYKRDLVGMKIAVAEQKMSNSRAL
jgi:hypothetical protein